MLSEDYLFRLLRPFMIAIGQLLTFKKERNTNAALAVIDSTGQQLLGLNSSMMNLLSERYLLELLERDTSFGALRCLVLARLLKEEGDVVAMQGDEEGAVRRYLKSLSIYMDILPTIDKKENPDELTIVEDLSDKLRGFDVPPELNLRLVRFFETNRRYGRAEDVLFDMIDANIEDTENVDAGIAFYQRLQQKHPQDLSNGNLPVEEVNAGLAELIELRNRMN